MARSSLLSSSSLFMQFNSGTYTGVSLWVLSLYGYMPKNSLIYKRAPDMIAKSWQTIGEAYNPTLHSLSGPFDRSFGVNMVSLAT